MLPVTPRTYTARFIFGLLPLFFSGTVSAKNYLLSDLKILRTPTATFTVVYLGPNQYLKTGHPPTAVGELMEQTATQLATEAGDFIVEDFSNFYRDDPKALSYIQDVIAPSVKGGNILDGHSGVLLVYRRSLSLPGEKVTDSNRPGQLVGVLKSTWVTPEAPRFPFQGDRDLKWPEVEGENTVQVDPWHVERKESREIKHLAVSAGGAEDITGLLAYFGSQYGVLGERVEKIWSNKKMVTHKALPDVFYLRSLPLLVNYYRRRGQFEVNEELSGPEGVVMSLSADRWDPERIAKNGLPGMTGVKTLLAQSELQSVQPSDFVMTLDDWQGPLPDSRRLADIIANGEFRPITKQERCDIALAAMAKKGFHPLKFSPGFRGTIDP